METKYFSELRAHQYSTLLLCFLCAVYIWIVYPLLHIRNTNQALFIGVAWAILTVIFEFSLGRMTGKSWYFLFRDFNLTEGRLWTVFVLFLTLLPLLYFVIKRL